MFEATQAGKRRGSKGMSGWNLYLKTDLVLHLTLSAVLLVRFPQVP